MPLRAYPILGIDVAATTYREAFEVVSEWAKVNQGARLVEAANTHVLALARHDEAFGKVMGSFDAVLPDGMPLVWVLNRRYRADLQDRVYGPTFMAKALGWSQESAHQHVRHFLLGSTPEILKTLETKFREQYPDTAIVGVYSPPFGDWDGEERAKMVKLIRASEANFVWTCFGCPKQETFLAEMKSQLPDAVYFGIGAAFAFHAGAVRQAPGWMQRLGLEWCFRLAMEPRRLFTRYLVHNTRFLWYLWADRRKEKEARNVGNPS